MMVRKYITALLALASGLVLRAQSDIKVDVPNMVGEDEQFNITFIIEGENEPSDFSWSQGDDFSLVWGPQRGSSTSIRIENGKRTKSVQYTYTYILMPRRIGKFEIPQASAKIGGKTIASPAKTVEVLQASSTGKSAAHSGSVGDASSSSVSSSDIFLRLTLSKTKAVIGEPLTAELKLYQRADIAGFEGAKFPSFEGFWSQETVSATNIDFHREEVDGQIYNAALLRRYTLIPQQTGILTIAPAELVCLVNVRTASHTANSIFDSFFDDGIRTVRKRVSSPATKIEVTQLPSGAPEGFTGAVGNFSLSAALSTDKLKTHEAVSLTVTVTGHGNVSLVEAPKVNFPPDMEVYDVKTTDKTDKSTGGTSGSKVFEYPFIPRSYGDFTIPPIKFSYFDTSTRQYHTLSTEPISYHVEKGVETASSQSSHSLSTPDRHGVRNIGEDIRYIQTRKPSYQFRTEFLSGKWYYWAAYVLLGICTVSVWYLLSLMHRRSADVAGSKNRRATRMAMGRLKKAGEFLRQDLYSAFYQELHTALLGYISDKLNMGAEALNKENILSALQEHGADASLADKYVNLIDACEYARYSPDSGHEAMNTHYEEALDLISRIDPMMKMNKSKKNSASVLPMLAVLLVLPYGAKAVDTSALDSLWNEGVHAYESGDWQRSVSAWSELGECGVVSPELYYNLGNANFKSGDYARAILYYERTLKADPSYSDARFNLEFANSLIQDKIEPVPEFLLKVWARKLSYIASSDAWAVWAFVFMLCALSLAVLFLTGGSIALRRTGFYGGFVCVVLFVVSVSMSLWQRGDYMKRDYAIVMSPVTSVKSSPSTQSAKDLFILHEGTKVRVTDAVGEWRNITLSDGREGWIDSREIEEI